MSSRDIFARLFESAPDGIVVVDSAGVIRMVNKQLEVLFGYSRDELMGKQVEMLVPARIASKHPALRARYVADPVARPMGAGLDLMARRKDGTEFPVDIALSPLETEDGVLVSAAVRDITERTLAESARAALAAIVRSSHDAIIGKKIDGTITSWNPAAERLYGFTPNEALGRNIQGLLLHVENIQEEAAILERAAGGEGVEIYETVRFTKHGKPVTVSVSLSPIHDARGAIIGVASIHRDITERKRSEKERELLRQQQSQRLESLGQLAGGVAHDFNNLLAAILNYAGLILDEPGNVESVRQDVHEIVRAAERAAALAHQLLIFGRREIVKPEVLDLNEIVRDLEKLFRRTIGEHIDLRTSLTTDLYRVNVDPSGIEQVLMNLVVNARDAMPTGGILTIHTGNVEISPEFEEPSWNITAGHYVRMTVADSGTGMPPEVVTRAFEPFFTTKPRGEGTGLGLATVYGIVMQAGGDVHIYSEPGKGTAVSVYLPASEDTAIPVNPGTGNAPHGHGEIVVVVEDEDLVREPTTRVLARRGYVALSARNGVEALELLRSHSGPVDLLLTDVVMPQMSGVELAERVRDLYPGTPVLYTSGYPQDLLERGKIDSSVPLLEKPYTTTELLRRVRSMLDAGTHMAAAPGREE